MAIPKGKHVFGTVKVGEKGQIVIPKKAREVFDIKPGDTLLLLGDESQGIAIVKNSIFMELASKIMNMGAKHEWEQDFAEEIIDKQSDTDGDE